MCPGMRTEDDDRLVLSDIAALSRHSSVLVFNCHCDLGLEFSVRCKPADESAGHEQGDCCCGGHAAS